MQETSMKRWHEEFPRTYRQWRERHAQRIENYLEGVSSLWRERFVRIRERDRQVGRFRKTNHWSCSRRCPYCHRGKYPTRTATYQEWCAQQKLTEGIAELNAVLNGKT